MNPKYRITTSIAVLALFGCSSETPPSSQGGPEDGYIFESRFVPGEDSVSYRGQVARQVLTEDLKAYIGGMTDAIDGGALVVGGEGSVVSALDFYLRFDSDAYGSEQHLIATEPSAAQATYADISAGKNLIDKLAGQDTATDHRDWSTEFAGWTDPAVAEHGGSIESPEGLLIAFFEQLEANAIGRADGVDRLAPDGVTPLPVHVTDSGLDLQQLTQKFLLGAVAFSQGADDYLDDDVEGKGLLAPNTRDEGNAFTELEHAWDEGFGYFGAARRHAEFTDAEIAETPYKDVDGDGSIDLTAEYNFGASTNASKRDLGSATGTDFSGETFRAFWSGRSLIRGAEGALTAAQLGELKVHRDAAVLSWEKAIAATVVHYINETVELTELIDEPEYSFQTHAKVWSEMKGFALAFQFNPRSPLDAGDFAALHTLLGDAPVMDGANAGAYVEKLHAARDLLQERYAFDAADVEVW